MKQLIVGLAIAAASVPALAQHHGYWRHGHHSHGGFGWVAPVIIGGVVGYEIARNQQPVVVQQPPVVVQQAPTVVYIDGIAYSKQWMQINGKWQEVLVKL